MLAFCVGTQRACRRLGVDELGEIAGTLGLPPALAPALPIRAVGDEAPKLGVLRVHRQFDAARVDLNGIVAELDHAAARPRFALWHQLAAINRFRWLVLVAGENNANELGRWLRRRPPVARAYGSPKALEVSVYSAPQLVLASRKTKRPRRAF